MFNLSMASLTAQHCIPSDVYTATICTECLLSEAVRLKIDLVLLELK
jgi:hypothetical protein